MSPGPVLSPWLVLPLAGLAMLLLASHVTATEQIEPLSRRRIRLANGWVMLVATPLIAAGFSLIAPLSQSRAFAMVWLAVIGLLSISVLLALADIVNTIRLGRRAHRELREAASRLKAELHRAQSRGETNDDGA